MASDLEILWTRLCHYGVNANTCAHRSSRNNEVCSLEVSQFNMHVNHEPPGRCVAAAEHSRALIIVRRDASAVSWLASLDAYSQRYASNASKP